MGRDSIFHVKISRKAVKLSLKHGIPPFTAQRYIELFGLEEAEEFLEASRKGIPKSIRCNTLAIRSCDLLVEKLEAQGFSLEKVEWLPYAFRVWGGRVSLGATREYLLGYYYIQGLASMIPVHVLDPKPGEMNADVAAAPGGKTTQMAQLMRNEGCILAVEKNPRRARALVSNIQRMRVVNTIVIVKDMLELKGYDNLFDKVLLDAPCTGEGLLPLDFGRWIRGSPEEFRKTSSMQIKMLNRAIDLVRQGGLIAYSTCSIAPEENEYVISEVLEAREDITIVPTRLEGVGESGLTYYNGVDFPSELKHCLRLYPHKDETEGFFVCLLKKK